MADSLTAEDRLAVMEQLSRYAYAMDEGDPAAFIACFVAEPELDIGYRTVVGSVELREFADYYANKPGRPWQHHVTTITITGNGERCQSRSYLLMTTRDAEGAAKLEGTATYIDDFVKIDGCWLCEKHVVTV